MKKRWLMTMIAGMAIIVPAFVQAVTRGEGDVTTIDSRIRHSRPGEVLVKFKSTSGVAMRSNGKKFASSSVNAVDAALRNLGVTEVDELMPLTGELKQARRVKAFNGKTIELKDMSRLYRLKFDASKAKSVEEVVEQLKGLDDVEYAEPNYLVYALSTGESTTTATFNDPLYQQQWGPAAINLPALWKQELTTKKRPVIAILDTGVDTKHPDLADNIWTNATELSGSTGQDDDGNGFKDDINGWDFVNQTGQIRDFNGHGTHCAGIAAATGNNGIGVVGANPDALIMPVTVMQSDGVGDIATIIKGIDYATANGADVISMSFGGYAYSIAEEQALARAYSSSVLVAAAGNDFKCIYKHDCEINQKSFYENGPMFPAAFTFVLGVEASTTGGTHAGFSNFDHDGAITTTYGEEQMYNYELRAPGTGIYSTYPGGKYKSLNGTSMACPLVAGAISRLMQTKEITSKEALFGDLIHTRQNEGSGDIDIFAAYNVNAADRKPELSFVTYNIVDSIGGDGDGRLDAGEKISIYPVIRNAYGHAENIKVWITMGENEDETIVTFLDATEADFGHSLSAYTKATSRQPFQFQVSENCVDGRHIRFVLHASCDNMDGEITLPITLTVENGVEIGGMIEKDTTLEPSVHYIVTRTIVVPEGVTLTIRPGAFLKFNNNTGITTAENAMLIAEGTNNNPITFIGSDPNESRPWVTISNFYGASKYNFITFDNMLLYRCHIRNIDNSIITNCYNSNVTSGGSAFKYVNHSVFHNNSFFDIGDISQQETYLTSSFINNEFHTNEKGLRASTFSGANNISNNYMRNDSEPYSLGMPYESSSFIITETPSYFGSTREDIVRKGIYDIEQNIGTSKYDLSNMLTRPNPDAPGILWKVVVNGYDAQDEFEMLPPLGVGTHKFEIYYSIPQDKSWEPTIAMGVRPPYTQTSISEKGSWNEAGDIYTAYLTITGKMAIDGLNRIYVSSGLNADGFFPVPLENMRFNVLVSAAGSMSTGFEATPGLGKIELAWEPQEENVDDILGYNLYRFQYDEAGEATDTLRLNESLLDETEFIDYDVVPGKSYSYFYKIMRTSLTENSPSHVVAAIPLTASKGDANGSLSIDVADIVTEIGYMTNQNPQPFIFDAADVNSDSIINILDVVGTINIITNPTAQGIASIDENGAVYTVENGVVYVETPVALGGVQLNLNGIEEGEVTPLEALNGFESVMQATENGYICLAYSMSGKTLAPGRHALYNIGEATVENIVLSDTKGGNVVVIENNGTNGVEQLMMQLGKIAPNPFRSEVTIPFAIGKAGVHNVKIIFSDLFGRTIDSYAATVDYGYHSYTWRPTFGGTGIYIASLYVDGLLVNSEKLIRVK